MPRWIAHYFTNMRFVLFVFCYILKELSLVVRNMYNFLFFFILLIIYSGKRERFVLDTV